MNTQDQAGHVNGINLGVLQETVGAKIGRAHV